MSLEGKNTMTTTTTTTTTAPPSLETLRVLVRALVEAEAAGRTAEAEAIRRLIDDLARLD